MKIYITRTYGSPKYGLLYDSVYRLISNEPSFEIAEAGDTAECIVCVGDLPQELINHKRQHKTPVIRFLFRSDVAKHFYTDTNLVDYTFWVADLDINILCPYMQTSAKINVPFDFSPTANDSSTSRPEADIYVNTGEFLYPDSALFKILRTLNRFTSLQIDVCSANDNIKNIVNGNICIADSSGDIENHVKQSRMVIGSGYAILFAIKHHKPFIILGERGYGGIPTINHIEQFYHEFFQGTIGGRLDGALPENLVYEDVQNILNAGELPTADFCKILSTVSTALQSHICSTIANVVESQNCTDPASLKFNTDYTIIGGDGRYWLLNRFTRFIEAALDNEHIGILKHFVANDRQASDIPNDNKILSELVDKRILLKKRKSHP